MDESEDLSTKKNPVHELKEAWKSISWDKEDKILCCCLSYCSFCSICTFISSFVFFFVFGYLVTSAITANAIVDSPDALGYELWQSNVDNEAPPEYECFVFFNMTNYLDASQNSSVTPVYNETGPYCYRLYHEKKNVVWSDDGNEVSYNLFQNYIWAPEQSRGDAMTDIVVNLSPGYIGILATTGTEGDLTVAYTGPAFLVNVKWLQTVFVHHIQTENQPDYLSQSQTDLSKNISTTEFYSTWANATTPPQPDWEGMLVSYKGTPSGISSSSAAMLWDKSIEYSLLNKHGNTASLWFNATLDTLDKDGKYNEDKAAAQAQLAQIFNLTSSQVSMIADWLTQSYYPAVVDPGLVTKYSRNDPGVKEVSDLGWLQWGSCGVNHVSVSKTYNYTIGGGQRLDGTPEYGCFIAGRRNQFTVDQSKQLMNGTQGLFSMYYIGIFFNEYYLNAMNPLLCPNDTSTQFNRRCEECDTCTKEQIVCSSKRNSGYNCTLQNGICINQYNTTDQCTNSTTEAPCSLNNSTTVDCAGCRECQESGSGDGKLPSANCTNCNGCTFNDTDTECDKCSECETCNIFLNCYNEEYWDSIEEIWGLEYESAINFVGYLLLSSEIYAEPELRKVLFEGGGGLFPIRTVNNWIFDAQDPLMAISNPAEPNAGNLIQNMTTLDDMYNYQTIRTYTGKKNISQVAQYISYGNMTTIEPPYWAEPVPIDGITEWGQFQPFLNERDTKDLYTFDSTYLRNLHLQRTGSVKYRDVPMWRFMLSNATLLPDPVFYQNITGFANSTSFHQKCPVFYSFPHFSGCDEYYANRVIGVAENQDWKTDYTIVDVNPITGMVMHVNISLQVNCFLDADYSNLNRYYNVQLDTFYPIMIVYKWTTLSVDNALEYQVSVVWTAWIQNIIFAVLFAISLMCIVFAVTIWIKMVRRNGPQKEETINLIQ